MNNAAFSTALDIIPLLGEKIYSGNLGEIVLRESIQNSLDARSTKIEVTLTNDGNTWTLVVTDNGIGIDDYNDHFLKIGGSEDYKRNHTDNSIIGGFGLAKLAFFACQEWKVESKGWEVNKYIAENQLPFESCEFNQGTRITLTIPDRKVSWGYTSWIKEYLSLINRPVTFTFNGEEIAPFQWSNSFFGSETLKTGNTQRNGHILVRLNDLPTFYKWISGLENTVLLDFHSSLSPYDEGYPLIASYQG
jgi:HSP90 family molecular chaperone